MVTIFRFQLLFCMLFAVVSAHAQTVGVLKNTAQSFNGYTLFSPFSTNTYLIDNCGQVVNKWTSTYKPGNSAYLLEDGSLLRSCKILNDSIATGVGGRVERRSWNDSLMWGFNYTTSNYSQHHDIYPLPNGNVLLLVVNRKTFAEAVLAGRDAALIKGELYEEQIVEISPIGVDSGIVVWEWHTWDHLVQDFDVTKNNFETVANHPELIDVNFLGISTKVKPDWLHANSLQYNAELDQVMMSSRTLSEILIIDHSTTTAEASSHTGGSNGKGGDLIYRWGNPASYRLGDSTDQRLFAQHSAHWIPKGYPDEGKIMVFNNGFGRNYSSIDIIAPPVDLIGNYSYTPGTTYEPLQAEWSYTDPVPTDFYSTKISGAQRLPNGNTLIDYGTKGYFFEIDTSNAIVWEYINPAISSGAVVSQGDAVLVGTNSVFRIVRYAPDYLGFNGKDMTPGDPIELNFDISSCWIVNSVTSENEKGLDINVYPNPAKSKIYIDASIPLSRLELYNIMGKRILTKERDLQEVDMNNFSEGVYLLKMYNSNGVTTKKIIKELVEVD